MERVNTVYERTNADGTVDYIVNLGTVLYNNRLVTLEHRVIPLRGQNFFTLPGEKNKYAIVNCYYKVENGQFIYDKVAVYDKYITNASSGALHNLLPIAQFVLRQKLTTSFDVISYSPFSKMATFSITDLFVSGEQGGRGPLGFTGPEGATGAQGFTGIDGVGGLTGVQGLTGVGVQGEQGPRGETGMSPDDTLLLYLKFKADADLQPDYSLYRRDCVWAATGVGVTGGSLESSYTTEPGILDNCHSVVFNGGIAMYSYEDHLDFSGYTGTVQAWVRLDTPPIPDFTWTVDGTYTQRYNFIDASTYFPESWSWEINGVQVSTAETFVYNFPSTGDYVVTITATNAAGSSEKSKLVTVA